MKKNQVWVWAKDGILLGVFIIKEVVEWQGEKVAIFYGELERNSKYRRSFFDDMELIKDINELDLLSEEEKEIVIKECKRFNVPIPGMK